MITSPEDASLLFDRWKQDQRSLKIMLRSSALFFEAVGTVANFNPQTVELTGTSWRFTIPLAGATYSFSDPREVPIVSVREAESAQYELGIAVELPNGDKLGIMELKAFPPFPDPEEPS
ncbi:MAG TPA: hypothetical protein VGJ09_00095 [Bryobacteraceae bacterium]|jgi:hypothetical protein